MREWLRTALFTSIGIVVVCLATGALLAIRLGLSLQTNYQYPGGFRGPTTTGKAP